MPQEPGRDPVAIGRWQRQHECASRTSPC